MKSVEKLYDSQPEREWNRLLRHRTEFAVTMKVLEKYLPMAPAEILDIGSGPGRYAIELAQKGHQMSLVDLSYSSLELAKEKAAEVDVKFKSVMKKDATDLSGIPEDSFDGVLLFGPLYHLISREQRVKAILEAKRVLKSGKPIFSAHITRFAPFRNAAVEQPEWLTDDPEYAYQVLRDGIHTEGKDFPNAYFAHPTEIKPLMEECGFETLILIGTEGIVAGHEDAINSLEGSDWEAWVELNYQLGQDPSLYGAADHLLFVGRKTG